MRLENIKKLFLYIFFALFCFYALNAETYIDNLGVEFESGTAEKTDELLTTIDDYYTYYKSNFLMKMKSDEEIGEVILKTENGIKDYSNDNLDNHFHFVSLGWQKPLSEIFSFDLGLKSGILLADKFKDNSYTLRKIEPKIIAKVDNYEFFSSIVYQLKWYKSEDKIRDNSLNFGIKRQFTDCSNAILTFGIKKIDQNVDDIGSKKNSQYAKIGYYWQR
jgi:hypothetical protein